MAATADSIYLLGGAPSQVSVDYLNDVWLSGPGIAGGRASVSGWSSFR